MGNANLEESSLARLGPSGSPRSLTTPPASQERPNETSIPITVSSEPLHPTVIGGYAVLEAKSLKEAIELTKRFLRVHGDEWDIECEIRPLDGPEFGAQACPSTAQSR